MQRLRKIRFATMLVASALTCASAAAQELIVMPYRCTVYDGRPVLTPSEDHGYRVIGHREQRSITSCSPADPGLCREWALHRFEMDCGGVAVPWTSVIASAYADRVRNDGGQLQIRMPPRWAMAPDDPCARGYSYEGGGWRRGRFNRYCDDQRALSPPPYVSLPAGFAPMFGINAVFVAARTPPGQPLPPPVSTYEGPRAPVAGQATPPPPAPRKNVAVLPAPPAVKDVQPKAAAPAPSPGPKSEPVTNGEMPPSAPIVTPLSGKPPPEPGRTEAPPTPGTIAVPKIINRETAPEPVPARPPVEQRSEPSPVSSPVSVETTVVPAPRPAREKAGIAAFLTGPDAPLVLALAALGSIALVGGIAAWRLGARKHAAPERDLSSISFGSGPHGAVVRSRSTPPPPPPRPAPSVQFPADLGIGDRMPATRADALRVLGMGVTAGATAAALKKVIDGLRQTWHPDLAQDPDERALRELRMKQLNAAWEILSPKPAQDPTG